MSKEKINDTIQDLTSIHLEESKILIVDDVPANLDLLRQTLESKAYNIFVAPSGELALSIVRRAVPDLILLDVVMPGMDGFETCRRLKANPTTADIPVIFLTAKGEPDSVLEGFRAGGVDYITKPFQNEEVLLRIETHLKIDRLTKVLIEANTELATMNKNLQQEIARREKVEEALQTADEQLSTISRQEAERWGIDGFIGKSKTIGEILSDVRKLQHARTTNVLITGESGTGKELIARAIHYGSFRKGPFVPVNCPATPSGLAESTFFGHVRGAFTGADTARKGCFELADGGTLFLDEIGDMPLELQAKLLRVLEDGYVTPVGGNRPKHVDVRVLSATNADLQTRISEGKFREDLYFRLAGFPVIVPPLRERKEDIPLLAHHFLRMWATEMGRAAPVLTPDSLAVLESYAFPGNVRELKNIIERAIIKSGGTEIQPRHLDFFHPHTTPSPPPSAPNLLMAEDLSLDEMIQARIEQVLEMTGGNQSEAARRLKISRDQLRYRIEKYQMKTP